MKTYTIKPEYVDRWTNMIEDEHKPVTEDEIRNLAREWDVTVDDLLEQVEELEPTWIIIDERDGDEFAESIPASAREYAARRLIDTWERMSRSERKHHKLTAAYAIMIDGIIDWDSCTDAIEITDREINLNNGSGSWYSPDEVDANYNGDELVIDGFGGSWDAIVEMMDDDTRELIHAAYAPCTCEEFIRAYLRIAPADLIIG